MIVAKFKHGRRFIVQNDTRCGHGYLDFHPRVFLQDKYLVSSVKLRRHGIHDGAPLSGTTRKSECLSLVAVSSTTDSIDDLALVQKAKNGDEKAFSALMRLHHERTFRLVYSVVRHEQDARDVCQEVWLTVWKQLPRFRGEARFTTWLHPIAVRRSLDHLRKRKRWYDRFLPFSKDDGTHFESIATDPPSRDDPREDRIAQVRRALATLPPKHRAVLALREIEGLSYEEISRVVKIPTGTVMSRIYHARRILAKKIGVTS